MRLPLGRYAPTILKRFQSTTRSVPSSSFEDITTIRAALRGTAPAHQSLLLLYTKTPPQQWTTDVSKISPLMRDILPHVPDFHGKVLVCYPGDETLRAQSTALLTKGRTKDYRPYTATFFTKLTYPFEIPLLSTELLPQFLKLFKSRTQTGINVASVLEPVRTIGATGGVPSQSVSSSRSHLDDAASTGTIGNGVGGGSTPPSNFQARSLLRSWLKSQDVDRKRVKKTWILVCTHGARDCRCGERGPVVAAKLREYIRERELEREVIIGEVSHVGGHRYAPNVLVYPHGDWYGTLQPDQVESFMDSLLGVEEDGALSGPQSPLWRGSWFDHPGVPSPMEIETREEKISVLEQRRIRDRNALERMRVERDGGSSNEGQLEENWGSDLDSLSKGD